MFVHVLPFPELMGMKSPTGESGYDNCEMKARLDMSLVQLALNRTNGAVTAMSEALRLGGNEAVNICRTDLRFASIRTN